MENVHRSGGPLVYNTWTRICAFHWLLLICRKTKCLFPAHANEHVTRIKTTIIFKTHVSNSLSPSVLPTHVRSSTNKLRKSFCHNPRCATPLYPKRSLSQWGPKDLLNMLKIQYFFHRLRLSQIFHSSVTTHQGCKIIIFSLLFPAGLCRTQLRSLKSGRFPTIISIVRRLLGPLNSTATSTGTYPEDSYRDKTIWWGDFSKSDFIRQ